MSNRRPGTVPRVPTILQRLTDIGLSEDRARQHLTGGYVRVGRGDGTVVRDPDTDVEPDAVVRFQPEPVTDHA